MQKIVAVKIRDLRKQAGLTQEQIADGLSISQNAYSMLESGQTKIDIERLYQIAELLKVEARELLPPNKKRNKN